MSDPTRPERPHLAIIAIHGLRLRAHIGVYTHERRRRQPLHIDVECSCDIAAAAHSDTLQDTVDFRSIVDCLRMVAYERRYVLLETLCQHMATRLLAHCPAIAAVTLTARKPRALRRPDRRADWAAVRVSLSR